jgi:mRNA interferase MazF
MRFMPNYFKNNVVLVKYPFSDLSSSKVRPAVVVSAPHISQDIMITPLTNKINTLSDGEFVLSCWLDAGLNVETAVKRGIYTVHESLVIRKIGVLDEVDAEQLERSLQSWLKFSLSE